ncbi:MAG TPA: hypothetical protein VNZ52_02370 [Candidatus Thermoplasmatota archaeon]|nr:hypothetical protein [Candidatus Thermoplasmatota archaeon]
MDRTSVASRLQAAAAGLALLAAGLLLPLGGWAFMLFGPAVFLLTLGRIARRESTGAPVPEFPQPPFWRSLRVYSWKFTHFLVAIYLTVFALGMFVAAGLLVGTVGFRELGWLVGGAGFFSGLAGSMVAWMRHSDRTGAYLMGWWPPRPRGLLNEPR